MTSSCLRLSLFIQHNKLIKATHNIKTTPPPTNNELFPSTNSTFSKLGSAESSVGEKVGDILGSAESSVGEKVGDILGSAVRVVGETVGDRLGYRDG